MNKKLAFVYSVSFGLLLAGAMIVTGANFQETKAAETPSSKVETANKQEPVKRPAPRVVRIVSGMGWVPDTDAQEPAPPSKEVVKKAPPSPCPMTLLSCRLQQK